MDGYILSIDQGTSSAKAHIFDRFGRVVASARRGIAQYHSQEGWTEEDLDEIWRSVQLAISDALKNAGFLPEDIAAIGVTNQQGTTAVWDKVTGEAIGRAIVWQDRRSQSICERFSEKEIESLAFRNIGEIVPNLSSTKLCWLLENNRAVQKTLSRNSLVFGTIDSWLIWKLSGGTAHITDFSNASNTGLLNMETSDWDDASLRLFKIPRQILPEIRRSSEIYAITAPDAFFGVRIPIGACLGDQSAAAFGEACLAPGMIKTTIGTGSFMVRTTGERRLPAKGGVMTPILWKICDSITYGLLDFSDVSGELLRWLQSNLGFMDNVSDVDSLAMQVPDSGGVYFVPSMIGMHTPIVRPKARGTLFGLKLETTRQHIVRATLESLAYQTRDMLENMERAYGFSAEGLRLDGGCSQSNFLMQFLADITGIPVERPDVIEASSFGAACLAGLAIKYWGSTEEAVGNWRLGRRFEPMISEAKREELYGNWLEAVDLAGDWQVRRTGSAQRETRREGSRLDAMSPREREVMRLFVLGLSMRDISERLHTSIKTVEKQRREAMSKLGVENFASAIRVCIELGLDKAER